MDRSRTRPEGGFLVRSEEVPRCRFGAWQLYMRVCPRDLELFISRNANTVVSPILTYDKRGCTKPGIRPEQHGIIHSSQDAPQVLVGEPQLGFAPVPVVMYGLERLSIESRIHYAKLQTISHNARVIFIGLIEAGYFGIVLEAVDQCWSTRHKSSRHRNRR